MKTIRLFGALLSALALSLAAFAVTPEQAKNTSVTVSFTNIQVGTTLKTISQITKIPTHYAPPENDPVITVKFTNTSADEIFKSIAQITDMAVVYREDGVHFTPKK